MLLNLRHFSEADRYITILTETDEPAASVFQLSLCRIQRDHVKAEEVIKEYTSNESAEWWLEVGLFYWDMDATDKSLEPFLKVYIFY